MNLFDFFMIGQNVVVMVEEESELTFANAEIKAIDTHMFLTLEDGTSIKYSMEQAEDTVFKKTPIVEDNVKRFLKGEISREGIVGILISDMLSVRFCDQCRTNHKTPIMVSERVYSYGDTSITINNFDYLGFIWVGDDETGTSEEIFQYNGRYFVSYLAGNQHEHLAPISNEAFEEIKNNIIKQDNERYSYLLSR